MSEQITPGALCYVVVAERDDMNGRIVTALRYAGTVQTDIRIVSDAWYVNADWLPQHASGWVCRAGILRPITGPAAEQSIRETDTVKDHAEITERLAA